MFPCPKNHRCQQVTLWIRVHGCASLRPMRHLNFVSWDTTVQYGQHSNAEHGGNSLCRQTLQCTNGILELHAHRVSRGRTTKNHWKEKRHGKKGNSNNTYMSTGRNNNT